MSAGVNVGIALGVAAGLVLLWWVFESAPAGSRRQRFDHTVRLWGQRQTARGWRRPSFISFAVTSLLIVVLLVWSASR